MYGPKLSHFHTAVLLDAFSWMSSPVFVHTFVSNIELMNKFTIYLPFGFPLIHVLY